MLRIRLDSITPIQQDAWRKLAADAVEPNVFLEADYVLAAARAFGVGSELSLLVDAGEGGEWNGCLTVREQRLLGRPAMSSTWKHHYSFLGTPLVRTGRTDRFAEALIGAVRSRQVGLLLSLQEIADGPVLAAIRAAQERSADIRIVRASSAERAALKINGDPDGAVTLGTKGKKSLAKRRRGLCKELGLEEIAGSRRPSDAESVELFLALEAASWKGEAGTAMACDERHAGFFRTVCARLAEQDRLYFRSLEADGRIAAMTTEFGAGDVIFGFKSAFDEDLKRFSPGKVLQVDNLRAINVAADHALYDSCGDPENEALNALWPDRRALSSLVFARDDLRGNLASRALEARAAARARRAA
jgi:CelD/BcsL family acetyltransferase involved in cellulose biosynthesis